MPVTRNLFIHLGRVSRLQDGVISTSARARHYNA